MKQTTDESARRPPGISTSGSGRARGFVDESFGPARVLTDRVDNPWITLRVTHRLTTLADFSPTTPPALLLIWMEQQKNQKWPWFPLSDSASMSHNDLS